MNAIDPARALSIGIRTEPILRWAGSKRRLLPILSSYWSESYLRYVEPFVGSAVLFFRIQPASAILGDINAELMEVYEVVRSNPDRLHGCVSSLPSGEENYYKIRSLNRAALSKVDRAARFVYLNRHCFNGIFRTNDGGHFNVPFGGLKPGVVPAIETFRKCALLLDRASLRYCDFGQILSTTRKGDFVYLDPPYAVESRRVFREYGPKHFAKADLNRLSRHLMSMDKRGVHFVVSYAECKEAKALLKRWDVRRVRVRRHIAGFTSSRRGAYELIATNATRRG